MAVIFDIRRSSVHDGPGVRTTVFFKGCPLNCVWCHNPESKSGRPQLSFLEEKCLLCGKCASVCKGSVHGFLAGHAVDFERCVACGDCVEVCAAKALNIYGQELSSEEIMETVIKDKVYYDATGGGLTVSGGEPFAQYSDLFELLKLSKDAGINTCVETSGFTAKEKITEAAPWIDLFLFDCKHSDSQKHRALTGVGNEVIAENFKALYSAEKSIILRCPIVPGINDDDGHLRFVAGIKKKYPRLVGVEILPYHDLGKGKAESIGVNYEVSSETLSAEAKENLRAKLASFGADEEILRSF